MYLLIETPTFAAEADKLWSEEERVIYFTRLSAGEIWLLLVYAKSVRESIPGHLLKAVREEIENG